MSQSQAAIQHVPVAQSLRDTVERSLSAAIISGELAPGTLVSVPTLAVRFGVSATPVREAMLNLEKRGFVEPVKNKGFRVTQVSEQDLRDLVQVRRWLEGSAMHVVAERFADAPVDEYRALADDIVAAAERSDFPEYLAADVAFHLALLSLVGNDRLIELVSELRRQTRMVGLALLADTEELRHSALEHHELLDLLAAGKADEARALMHTHIGHVLGWWAGHPENGATQN